MRTIAVTHALDDGWRDAFGVRHCFIGRHVVSQIVFVDTSERPQKRAQMSLSSSVCKWRSIELLGREASGEAYRELVADARPILRRHRPLLGNVTRDQKQQLARRLRTRK